MGNFRSDRSDSRNHGYGNGRRSRDDRPSFRDRDNDRSGGFGRRRPEVHDVICDKCGKETDVPFKPTGNKPVLCRDCFRKKESSNFTPRESSGSSQSNSSGISQEQFKELNKKLDKILGILEMIEFEDEEDDEEEEDNEEDGEESDEDEEDEESEEEEKDSN